jgi:acyl-CoA synthetase (AMP-forming)/AMP-acid ligase II
MIIRGGENIYPREIEEFLFTHPKISDVQVIGVPDEKVWRGSLRLGGRAKAPS